MRIAVLALIFCLAGGQTALAGAWLREEGKGFASVSASTTQDRDFSGSLYLEYGLTPERTLGADISFGLDRTGQQNGSGVIFVRFPIGPTDQTHRFAGHVGLGGRYTNGVFSAAVEAGLSWGRGVQWRDNWGWAAVDASINLPQAPAENRIKLDGTFGMGFTPSVKAMIQMFNTLENGQVFSDIAPSLLIQPRGGPYTIQIGAEFQVAGGSDRTLKIGLWRDF
ncbi:hypothetical protein [uncultured Roseobacter sp.]|uniref:hypothetical protein n=1 Tax=uncultured Roseobacter sp. TaxID=114847 RepID=UPI002624DDF5|nr:hypothetical protein [uncultured Roseobacter sp.]